MESLFLIVGLGNPGARYSKTRHNVGFMAVDLFGERRKATWSSEDRFEARVARSELDGRRLLLAQPQTFMNASGRAVRKLVDYFKITPAGLLVVVDDADLGLGEIRLRPEGSAGGHHGLESIEEHLGTRSYPRLRIGIGRREPEVREITAHVLGKFEPSESEVLRLVLEKSANQMECWLTAGIGKAMSQFNGGLKSPTVKES